MEYPHERAVADGVNVGYDVYRIKTQVTGQGGTIEKGLFVDRRDKKTTRKLRWEATGRRPSILREGARSLRRGEGSDPHRPASIPRRCSPQLFPGRNLVPKTLIFCKDDSHAEDIVHLCREVFGKGNDFCQKDHLPSQSIPRPASRRMASSSSRSSGFRPSSASPSPST